MRTSASDRFQRVDAAFDAVLDQATSDQAAFIERIAAGDPELRDDLARLLRAHHRAGGILDASPSPISPMLFEALGSAEAPSIGQIGPFRIERTLGQGGMGQVFLGVRDDGQFTQRVALKVIRHASPGLLRRFLEERRILARLEHPRIARLIDGGITAEGMPYFAMELIDGEPIDQYCESRNLGVDERIRLFEQVCDAVSYAHRHLVIHRDLKPGNILVTADGQVKLLDFGIAKLLDVPGGEPRLDLTRTGMRVMTPEIAAPEQFRGDDVGTSTDVYALGMLLYRLLSGERPYELRDRSPAQMERIVLLEEPPPPSTKARPADRRRIAGDLDVIVLTALRKQPERRYQSADALAEELRRFREGRAIQARPDTFTYRAGKFVSRHRVAVAFATAMTVAVGVGVARERVLRQRAELEARKATEVQKFLAGVFEDSDPFAWSEPDRGTISARDLLERSRARLDSGLAGEPEVQAELRTVLGHVYETLGLYSKAEPVLRRALAQRMALHGPRDTSVARTKDVLGMVLTRLDRYDQAESLLVEARAIRQRELGLRARETAESATHLASVYEEKGQFAKADSLHTEALATNRIVFGDSSLEASQAMNDLALVAYRQGNYERAEPLYRKALAIQLAKLGEKHALTAATMHNLGQTLESRGRMDEAEQLYRRSLAAKRAVLGDAHPSVTIGLNNLGLFIANTRGKFDDAETMVREALTLDRRIFGPRHSYVAEGLRNLGMIMRGKGQYQQSDSALAAAIAIDEELLGAKSEKTAMLYFQRSQTRYQMGDSLGAVRMSREAYEQYREIVGSAHPNTTASELLLARYLGETGRPVEALALADSAKARLDSTHKNDRPSYIAAERIRGVALTDLGRPGDAIPILERALRMVRAEFGEENFRTAHAKLSYARALTAKGRAAEARELSASALRTLEGQAVKQPRLVAQARAQLARPGSR